jgi:putative redox protein
MGIKARTMGFDLDDMKVEVLKIMKADPRRVGGIELTFHIPAHLEKTDEKTRSILKYTGDNCPVMKSIHPDIEVKIDWGSWA